MINVHLFLDKHIWCYHVLMKTNKYKISPVQYGIIAIIGFVIALSAVFIYIQASYSGKLKSIEVVVSNGPVSPESQQTQAILISKDSCTFTTTKTLTNQSSSEPCVVQPGKFIQIQKDVATYGLVEKIIANQNDSENDLLGGKKYSFKVTLNDGTSFTTEADNNFIQSIEPLLDNLNLYVPQFSRLGL